MTDSELQKCKEQIKRHVGLRLCAYRDSRRRLRIGYGHIIAEIEGFNSFSTITQSIADMLFTDDFWDAFNVAEKAAAIDGSWDYLNVSRQAVLVNIAFNLNEIGLLEFSDAFDFIVAKEYDKAADAILATKWAKQAGDRAIELARQMRTGEWQEGVAK
ncbi:MAG: hypothetical protein LBQ52_05360 [Helicobacteraceae bacterium]|jgi:lysozyme|nr:hypothetical protein [Helicobacteraceae bacterium]